MNDPIADLLKRADAPPPSASTKDVSYAIRQRYSRRRRYRIAVAAMLVPVFCVWVTRTRPEPVPGGQREIAKVESTEEAIERLEREELRGRAAVALLMTAERREGFPDRVEQAREDYASIVELFPNTPWAETARVRLAALQPRKGG